MVLKANHTHSLCFSCVYLPYALPSLILFLSTGGRKQGLYGSLCESARIRRVLVTQKNLPENPMTSAIVTLVVQSDTPNRRKSSNKRIDPTSALHRTSAVS